MFLFVILLTIKIMNLFAIQFYIFITIIFLDLCLANQFNPHFFKPSPMHRGSWITMSKGELWPKPKLQVKKKDFLLSQLPSDLKYNVNIYLILHFFERNYLEHSSEITGLYWMKCQHNTRSLIGEKLM